MSTVILSCESLEQYVVAAQKAAGTNYPVVWMNRKYHDEPAVMREHLIETIASLPSEVDTVLVAMGFCGGSWSEVKADRRIVLPRVDDCVSLLLHTVDALVRICLAGVFHTERLRDFHPIERALTGHT